MRRVLVGLVALAMALPGAAAELAGVSVPDSVVVGGHRLVLNGLGLRKKAIFKVYVGVLYLPTRSSDPSSILSSEGPRRIEMRFVRDVDRGKVADAWKEGFAANSAAALATLKARLDDFASRWVDMKNGSIAAMTYAAGTLSLEIDGKPLASFQGKDFADAVLACWLGPSPPSEELKAGVLGK
jgi:hypothetical protein